MSNLMLLITLSSFVVTVGLALLFTPLLKKIAFRLGIIDKPNYRKVHKKIMPRLGGVAIYLAFTIGVFIFLPFVPYHLLTVDDRSLVQALLTGGTVIVLLGALDDKFDLNAKLKFVVQIGAACIVVFGFGVKIHLLNLPFAYSIEFTEFASTILTLLWIVGVTNAINLIDGLDGLAAGVSGIAICSILVMGMIMGNVAIVLLTTILLGSIVGFLYFNFYPAKIFMGDSGALFLGFSLATLSIIGFKQITFFSFITPLLIIGVPLSDTFFAIVRRWNNNKSIFEADKGHLHHCLQQLGFSHRQTVLIIYGIAAFFGMCAVVQSIFANKVYGHWITYLMIVGLVLLMQIGSELIGLVDQTRKPLLDLFTRLRVKRQQVLRK